MPTMIAAAVVPVYQASLVSVGAAAVSVSELVELTLEIVTPEDRVYSDTVDTVVIPTLEGEIGILPGHIPLLTQVADGELRVTKGTETTGLVVGEGFAEIEGGRANQVADVLDHQHATGNQG